MRRQNLFFQRNFYLAAGHIRFGQQPASGGRVHRQGANCFLRGDIIQRHSRGTNFANRNDAACARAVPALEAACADRQSTSCVSLGSLYDGGFGIARDRRKAAGYYKTACDLADQPGCARLAVLEAQGLGVPPNPARARKTLESLCAAKVPEACIGLAQILQRTGVAADRDRARALLKSTCDAGSAEACGLIARR